eukprot:gene35436-42952_t
MISKFILLIFIVIICFSQGISPKPAKESSKSQLSQADQHILHAAAQGLLSEVKNAVNQGANIDVADENSGVTPLMWAAKHGYADIVKYLLSKKAKLTARSTDRQQSALMWAVYSGNLDIFNLIIKAGGDPEEENYRGDTPLALAAYMGHSALVSRLIKLEVDADFQTKQNDFSALHFASYKGHVDVVRMLLQAGARADVREKGGRTPLLLAAMEGHEEVIETLLAHSPSLIHAVDRGGHTALTLAVAFQRDAVVKDLLDRGVEMEHRINQSSSPYLAGDTALLIATRLNAQSIATLLLEKGADASVQDAAGVSVGSVALQMGHRQIYALIEAFRLDQIDQSDL